MPITWTQAFLWNSLLGLKSNKCLLARNKNGLGPYYFSKYFGEFFYELFEFIPCPANSYGIESSVYVWYVI